MITQSISNHPVYGFKSQATLAGINIPCLPFMGEEVTLTISVEYFDENGHLINIIPPNIVSLRATKDTMVNTRGQIVPAQIEVDGQMVSNPEAVCSEYDALIALLTPGNPVDIGGMCVNKILWADTEEGGNRLHR